MSVCRYEGENSFRLLEESRLNWVNRIEQAMRRKKDGENKEEEKERERPGEPMESDIGNRR